MSIDIHLVTDERTPQAIRRFLNPYGRGDGARGHMARRRFLEVDRWLQPMRGARMLDIGTGWGYHAMARVGMGVDAVGVDLAEGPLGAGKRIADDSGIACRLLCADGARLPFADGVFDFVALVETIEHVYEPDRHAVFAECFRVLAPGGRLALSTPNYGGLIERTRRVLAKRRRASYAAAKVRRSAYRPDNYHLPWPVERLVDGLESAGFGLLASKYFLFVNRATPNRALPVASGLERAFESLPVLNRLAATVCLSAEKPAPDRGRAA